MTTRPEPFKAESLGITLHTVHRGDPAAPAVVLLHGGGANLHWWDHLAPHLEDRFHLVALDFRGHGDSEHPPELEVGAFHRDLEALLAQLGVDDVAIVGHSLGAHVALHHASHHAGVRGLVVIEPSRGATRREGRRSRLALAARRSYRSREEAVRRFRFLPPAPGAPESLRRAIAEHSVRREPDGRFGYKFDPRWFSLPRTAPPPLHRIACPSLIIRGADSSLLTPDGAHALAREIPQARLVTIEAGGHNVHLEQPAAVLTEMRSHLEACLCQDGVAEEAQR
jgi:pimeloyl-ACP methyl ester carboxylesterase